jgi:uncharacterized membrane protein YfhO
MPLLAIPEPLTITTNVTEYAPGKATITLDTPAPAGSAMMVSESFYPGWTATVDGQPARAERADLALIAVPLPAGARQVELRFESPTFETGKTVTLAAIAFALLAAIAGLLAERRRTNA